VIALIGDGQPLKGAGRVLCAAAKDYAKSYLKSGLGVYRSPASSFENSPRVLTITAAKRTHTESGHILVSMTAMNVWDLVALDELERDVQEMIDHG
jgi:hypothetical protein